MVGEFGTRLDQYAYGTQVYIGKTLCGSADQFHESQLPASDQYKEINVRCKKPIWGTDITILRMDNQTPLGFYAYNIQSIGDRDISFSDLKEFKKTQKYVIDAYTK